MSVPHPLQLVTFSDPAVALGIAVRLTMRYPVFARLKFGEWADVLAAQAARGHQAFVLDADREVRGFFGYALASSADAQAWASGTRQLRSEECLQGDCLILNAWASADRAALNFMVRAFRRLGQHKQAVYFKRLYADDKVRAACIVNSAIMARHLGRDHETVC